MTNSSLSSEELGPNLVVNPDLASIAADGIPEAWYATSPRPSLRPVFALDRDVRRAGRCSLRASGGGNPAVFGRWGQVVPITGGKHYLIRVVFRYAGFEDPNPHILAALVWRVGERPNHACPTDHIASFRGLGDGWIQGEQVFRAPAEAHSLDVELYLRFAANGTIWWDSVEVREAPAPAARSVRLATTHWSSGPSSAEHRIGELCALLDAAGQQHSDLVCLPEALNTVGLQRVYADMAEPIPGPFSEAFAAKALQYGMHVLGCIYERDGDLIYNTAFLLDRQGRLVGKYRKVHLYWPEEREGVTPGDDFPVFDLDLGRVGIMTCYDSWWPEPMRLLALRGADVVLFPNAGYEPREVFARPMDCNVYLVSASLNSESAILDTLGHPLVSTSVTGVVVAQIDLARRPRMHENSGGSLNASPGGRRALRHAPSSRIFDDIAYEAKRVLSAEC